ncbi:hypothetical protein [Paracoccus sp. (in: a-proteobacteria)]|uniref:hypothetical protein n=1 Tax=Paracoccus sp. TaxID=267 RepID=UPI003A85AFBA
MSFGQFNRQFVDRDPAPDGNARLDPTVTLAEPPSSSAATSRCRKSAEYGFPIHADLHHSRQHAAEIRHRGKPKIQLGRAGLFIDVATGQPSRPLV